MKPDPEDDRRRLEGFFRDELRRSEAGSPSFDDVAAYVEDGLDPEARALIEERLAADPALRLEVEDLRALRDQMRLSRPAATPRRAFVLAGLAAAAALAALAFWLGTPAVQPPKAPPAEASLVPAPQVVLKDGERRVALSIDGAVSGLPTLDSGLHAAVAGALRGVPPQAQGLESLRTEPLTLLGPETAAAAFGPRAPLGTRVSGDRPVFRWSPLAGARSYEVSVFDTKLQKRAGSGAITATEWTPERPLPRGGTYVWQVSALTGSGRVTAPAPPAPEARFAVVDTAALAEIERRRAQAPGSHLVAAVVFLEAGLLDEADAELRGLAAANPDSVELKRLEQALADLRRPR